MQIVIIGTHSEKYINASVKRPYHTVRNSYINASVKETISHSEKYINARVKRPYKPMQFCIIGT